MDFLSVNFNFQIQQRSETESYQELKVLEKADLDYHHYKETESYYKNYHKAKYQQVFPNTCQIGVIELGDTITETYCRCPSGTYGYTCQENFHNPCTYQINAYYPADPRIGSNYFVFCNINQPYLFKCPNGQEWNQEMYTCINRPIIQGNQFMGPIYITV